MCDLPVCGCEARNRSRICAICGAPARLPEASGGSIFKKDESAGGWSTGRRRNRQ